MSVQAPTEELLSGQIIDNRFVILGLIATGGMSEIYLVHDIEESSKPKVLKRLFPHLAEDSSFLNMFKNEARLAKLLNHTNLVQNYDYLSFKGDFFIVMEYLDGRDMLQIGQNCRAHKQNVPFDLSVYLIAHACKGLSYAHNLKDSQGSPLNLIHRDMSPENILVTFKGNIKVLDFGIAKSADNQIKTQKGLIKGKLGYVSPEAILGEELDARADIFALGATLYLFLSGRPPFSGEHPMEVFEKTLSKPISPLKYQSQIPKDLEQICMRCLEPKAKNRYSSAAELEAELQNHLKKRKNPLKQVHIAHFMALLYPVEHDPERQRIQNLLKQPQRTLKIYPEMDIDSAQTTQHTFAENAADTNDKDENIVSFSINSKNIEPETIQSAVPNSPKDDGSLYEQDEFLDEMTLEAVLNLWTDEQKSEITFVDVINRKSLQQGRNHSQASSRFPLEISQEQSPSEGKVDPPMHFVDTEQSAPTQNIRRLKPKNLLNTQDLDLLNVTHTQDLLKTPKSTETASISRFKIFFTGMLLGCGFCLSVILFLFLLPFILKHTTLLGTLKNLFVQ